MAGTSSGASHSVSAHAAHALAGHVEHVFGVMGNGNAAFLDALIRLTPARFTAVRHEAGSVVAADAYFRASGRLAVNVYGRRGLALEPMLIPEVDFAALAAGVGAEGVVVRELADLDRLASWTEEDPSTRRFLVLDCRISGEIVAPYQEEIASAGSR